MITLTEEPYDGPVGAALVQELLADLNVRYADDVAPDPAGAPTDEDYLAEVDAPSTSRPHGTFLVAWVDGSPLACGALRPLHDDPSVGEIKRMYTRPPGRRKGLSRLLLLRLEAIAAELGYPRLQLETGQAQPEAMALYESEGWHRIEPYGFYKHSAQSVCYGKDLVGP